MVRISCSGYADKNKYDQPHDETTDMEKPLFEHEFAEQCVAIYLFKDLTVKDSYTLLNDKKHAQSLRNKFQEAVSQCL